MAKFKDGDSSNKFYEEQYDRTFGFCPIINADCKGETCTCFEGPEDISDVDEERFEIRASYCLVVKTLENLLKAAEK